MNIKNQNNKISPNNSQIIIYQNKNGDTKIDVKLDNETVWLSQKSMVALFQTTKQNINVHIHNIIKEEELDNLTVKNFLTVQKEGNREVSRNVDFYNLDMIISVGYRIKSNIATQFRIWATKRLKEYIIKGFTMDDERLKAGKNEFYFDELIERVRDIRTSERNFYQKITDIYTTSIDYNISAELTKIFFATVQNKMHYGIHGKTAAELISERADSVKPNMGITCISTRQIKQKDIFVAKNYLNEQELSELNLIVDQYLSFAELQARNKKAMTMKDWIKKLDDFLRLNEKEILKHKGKISKKLADEKALKEFEKFKKEQDMRHISDFDKSVQKILKEKN